MKAIEQLIDKENHLIEFISPCGQGETLIRWFQNPDTLKTQQLCPKDSADWVKESLLRNGYHIT